MVLATNLGFPRIGVHRELKKATESYWKGKSTQAELLKTGAELRARHWKLQKDAGLDHIPSNDFSFYDHILDLCCTLGCVPSRYNWRGDDIDIDTYFAMARGRQDGKQDVTAMEMTKWFDTNYHYMVPEFSADQDFKLSSAKIFDEYKEARDMGIQTRPVIVGPLTFASIGKKREDAEYCRARGLIPKLTPVYIEILQKLKEMGAEWVQMDEPAYVLDLRDHYKEETQKAYAEIAKAVPGLKILVATYFDSVRDNADALYALPVAGIHIDLCRGPGQANTQANNADAILEEALGKAGDKILSLGVIDGRNIWKNDLSASLARIEKAAQKLGDNKVFVAPSSSLLHAPVDLNEETQLDPQIKNWLAFATQKLEEIVTLSRPRSEMTEALKKSDALQEDRKTSKRIHNEDVKKRVAGITPEMKKRKSDFSARRKLQHAALELPAFPTTTIGSFPQTPDIRKARAAFKKGDISEAQYTDAMQKEIQAVVEYQHKVDLDVLVHGEPERNDMVEYFGEQLSGFAFTQNGWVQSYGSRCVKPPIIFGDVSRPNPMTVKWAKYAQSLTKKIMKGMLTGPITILQWSFVRDDQPRRQTSRQIALAIRDEVSDLEKAGIKIIQIDEAAIREGLPLRKSDWKDYLDNAVEDFRLSASDVEDATQIHTHMCYSEFNDIIESIAAMDADVISIETSRSQMELLDAFVKFKYPNEIGPGVYDIHSPRIPTEVEMVSLLEKAAKVINADQLWVNPDCGLKTRGWAEVEPALQNMVAAAKTVRGKIKSSAAA